MVKKSDVKGSWQNLLSKTNYDHVVNLEQDRQMAIQD